MTHFLRIFVAFLLTFSLAGCGAQFAAMNGIAIVSPYDSTAVMMETKITPDVHTGITKISAPTIFYQQNLFGHSYNVRSWFKTTNPSQEEKFQIYVTAQLSDWSFLQQAYAKGSQISTTVIDRSVGTCSQYGCKVRETIGINFTRAEMVELSKSDFSFSIRGQRGSIEVTIPQSYLSTVLIAHDQAKRST